jgi:glucose-6-phosphate dehydrogenase assembly protein OpcA
MSSLVAFRFKRSRRHAEHVRVDREGEPGRLADKPASRSPTSDVQKDVDKDATSQLMQRRRRRPSAAAYDRAEAGEFRQGDRA